MTVTRTVTEELRVSLGDMILTRLMPGADRWKVQPKSYGATTARQLRELADAMDAAEAEAEERLR